MPLTTLCSCFLQWGLLGCSSGFVPKSLSRGRFPPLSPHRSFLSLTRLKHKSCGVCHSQTPHRPSCPSTGGGRQGGDPALWCGTVSGGTGPAVCARPGGVRAGGVTVAGSHSSWGGTHRTCFHPPTCHLCRPSAAVMSGCGGESAGAPATPKHRQGVSGAGGREREAVPCWQCWGQSGVTCWSRTAL